jgi:sarcosine oxidase subunit alpha
MEDGSVPLEGAQLVRDGKPAGRVTSSRWSPQLNRAIGMAWVPPDQAGDGTVIQIRVERTRRRATVHLKPFYDPDGERLRS